MITLRPYQEKARHWVNRQLNQNNNPLLVMPTGSGKSPTSAKIADDRISVGNKLLVLVPQYELFSQMLVDYSDLKPGYIDDTGVNGRNRNIYICMVQSLHNILNALPEKFCKQFSEIIIDEAHFSGAATWENIYNHFSHCLRFGMTATPLRYDNKNLGSYFNCIYEPIKIKDCIEKKYLSKPIVIIPEEYKNYVPQNPEDEDKTNQDIIKKGKIIGDILKIYRNVFNGEPVIIPCVTTEHAKTVAEIYKNDGWIVDHIHSGLTKYERSRIIRDVKNRKTNILITVGVGIFGLNIIGLKGIIWLRYTSSLTIWMQLNGRAARISKRKNNYVLIDLVGNCVTHGLPDIDRKWKLDTDYVPGQDIEDEAPGMKICPVCDTANAQENNKCWVCGYDYVTGLLDGQPVDKRRRKLPKFVDGNLVWLEGEDERENNNNIISEHPFLGNNDSLQNEQNTKITKPQKIEILKRDLIGLRNKSLFREGVKWL